MKQEGSVLFESSLLVQLGGGVFLMEQEGLCTPQKQTRENIN